MDLIVECKVRLARDGALLETEDVARGAHVDHLAVRLVEEDDALGTLEEVLLRDQVACDLLVGLARDERTRVNERVVARPAVLVLCRRNVR